MSSVFVLPLLLAAMSSEDAVSAVLNTRACVASNVFAEATAIVERNARAGDPVSQFVVGVTSDDKELAARCLMVSRETIRDRAEQDDDALAWYLLSVEKNDMAYLERAAEGGNAQALNALGTILTRGTIGRPLSSNELARVQQRSFRCFKRAAELRDPNGFFNLGTCLLRGLGCRKNERLAFECFGYGARFGQPEAMELLSECYRHGLGVEANSALALDWQMRARAARGDEAAATWLRKRK